MRFVLRSLSLLSAVGLLLTLTAGSADAVLILFKDGFVIQGRITQPSEYIVDKISGKHFKIPVGGAPYSIEDGTRKIIFSPQQVHDVLKDKIPDLMSIKFYAPSKSGTPLPPQWEITDVGPWGPDWERDVKLNCVVGGSPFPVQPRQRLTLLTPKMIRVDAVKWDWVPYYLTKEWDPGTVRALLFQYYTKQKEPIKPLERHLNIARFMLQAGWTDAAKRELDTIFRDFPNVVGTRADDMVKSLKEMEAAEFLENLETAERTGRYEELRNSLAFFAKNKAIADTLDPKELLRVQEVKNKLRETQEQMKTAERALREMPSRVILVRRAEYVQAAEAILKELTPDTLPRLETFLKLVGDHDRALAQKRPPGQSAETVMAFALSGWVLGDKAAEGNAPTAWQLWQARQLLQEYQKADQGLVRQKAVSSLKSVGLAPDVVARIIRLLPPPDPCEKLINPVIELKSEAPAQGKAVNYLVQVPPEYNHQRSYPALIVLHRADEKPAAMLNRWSELAAKHGYLLVAPSWGGGSYNYSNREHAAVTDCLRDLRRRFQVDSDRVFLFGAEEGGTMAYDVGLSHPDLFAGVMVMSAHPNYFSMRYKPNAQFLPFYVIDGERHSNNPLKKSNSAATNRDQFKDWVSPRNGYPVLYVEYRGRGGEWFEAELPHMMDWMNRKKRFTPIRAIGPYSTMRDSDNHFYWLSTLAVGPNHLNDARTWNNNVSAATMQATISSGNRIDLTVSGVQQITVWLAPGMIDFEKKVAVRLNGHPVVGIPNMLQPNLETLLEHFYYHGDRERLFLARIDVNIKGG